MKRILLAIGTRPEAIKMAPLYHALKCHPGQFDTRLCITGQHRHMLDQVLKVFDIRADIDLNIMKPGQDLFDVTSAVLLGMRDVLREHKPDVLLVHGDTTTALASGMAGFYHGVQVGHVEAGLRTHDLGSPFPEEFNRQVVGKVARWHFAPTEQSRQNLIAERVAPQHVTVTGNTVIDALLWVLARLDAMPARRQAVERSLSEVLPFDWRQQRFVLVTGHRRENFGEGFSQICTALKAIAARYPQWHLVYPVHMNPNVQGPVNTQLAGCDNVHLVAPMEYEPFVWLLKHAHIVLTDSGGIQEEAPSLGKPVLVMRDHTERPEAVAAGTVRLVGADSHRIIANLAELIDDESSYNKMAVSHNPYGDGQACERIISVLGEK